MTDADPDVARIAALESIMPGIQTTLAELGNDVKAMRTTMDNANGGLRVLAFIGGLGGLTALGHTIMTWLDSLHGTR